MPTPCSQKHAPRRCRWLLPLLALLLLAATTGCGYRNPYTVKESEAIPARKLVLTIWENRTNELGLESEYFRLFNKWFKKTDRVAVVFDENGADLKLTGEISAIDIPALFYSSTNTAREAEIKLTVAFTLHDLQNNTVLIQERRQTFHEPFIAVLAIERKRYNKQQALLRIGDEIAEQIYLRTLEIVSHTP